MHLSSLPSPHGIGSMGEPARRFDPAGDRVLTVQAVKDGLFHIYPISKIDEGIELLMGLSAGKKNKTGNFPANSVHGRVMKKLKAFDKRAQGEEE